MNTDSRRSLLVPYPIADVTVVISTFNRIKFLPEAIDSILAQYTRPARVIIVDDGSTDETQSIIEQYVANVDYVRKDNGGKARALNSILPSITTEYAWFFDDDDAAYPDALERLLGVLDSEPSLGFAFGAFDVAKSETKLLEAAVRPEPYLFSNELMGWQRLRLFRDCTVMMSGSLLRTEAVRAVGGLNEELIRCQDYDLMVRLAAKFDFAYCGSSVYIWREHDGARGSANTRHAIASRVAVWAKYNEPIGRYLRYQLPLTSFSAERTNPIHEHSAIRATLINRAWVLAPKTPIAFPVNDLIEAFMIEPSQPLDTEELTTLKEIFHHNFVSYQPTGALWRLWRLVLTHTGCNALAHLSKGLYWLGSKETRLLDRIRWMSVAIVLFSISKFGQALRSLSRF